MVSRQHTQATGKQRQAFMDAEFHGEIGDDLVFLKRHAGTVRSGADTLFKLFLDPGLVGQKAVVGGQFLQPFRRDHG